MSLPEESERAVDGVRVHVCHDAAATGASAGGEAARILRAAVATKGRARVLFASAPSQEEMLRTLLSDPLVDWSTVHAFHMDEYVGLPEGSTHAFGAWLEERLSAAGPGRFERMTPGLEPAREASRYAALVRAAQMDLVCMGIGMNGHIAFNEPGAARFDDPETVRLIRLDETSRRQQVEEGLFPALDDVPTHALTLTVPALLSAAAVVVTVHGSHKAPAVAASLEGPLGAQCPASAIRTHPAVSVYLDAAAAGRLTPGNPAAGHLEGAS
ncbi:glucosamine-6-phosphate deaminase [Streptomyces sp. V4I23]|uniref:6-phosphogluconolactonase n=1 Tax=Streptomyces sp. V4I23 TaxID=3042282 RepID=UPI00277F7728|nr:6-phosphogluconolactonase [Streptomyces sp. V4I23]MDQ1007065.1 glucosamine-6-phosphate deaminase [Streptomyces sp. V4I23]